MGKKKAKRVFRSLSDEEKARHAQIRKQAMNDVPPTKKKKRRPVRSGIGATLRNVRKKQRLTYYAVAKQAGIPNSNTVKDVEYGRDAKLSNIEAIENVLGLKLELIEA